MVRSNGNGWEAGLEGRSDETKQFVAYSVQAEREHWAHEARRKLIAVVAAMGGLSALVGVITFAVTRAPAADVAAIDVRTVKLEGATEQQRQDIHEVKAMVDRNEEKAEARHYRIEHKIDVVLDQVQPMARKTGAPLVPRPPRAVLKSAPEATSDPR